MVTPSYRIKNLDHLGLAAGMCRELGLAQMVDAAVPKQGDYQVSHGEALVAMIINGLGFHSRTLHMFPQFFADKPIERLLRPGVLPEHLNDPPWQDSCRLFKTCIIYTVGRLAGMNEPVSRRT